MDREEKEMMTIFKLLSKETKKMIISHTRFAVLAEKAALKKIKQQQPEYKLSEEPATALQTCNQA